MNLESNQSASVNVMDGSVSSLVTSLGQLKLNPSTGGLPPINRLPIELVHLIFAKLKLAEVPKLARLRLVCKHWQALVEDFCSQKTCLFLSESPFRVHYAENNFFGNVNLDKFMRLVMNRLILDKYNPELAQIAHFFEILLKLFPNIQQLSIYCDFATTASAHFAFYINSLEYLKKLDLDGPFAPALSSLSPTLFNLEYLAVYPTVHLACMNNDYNNYVQKIVSQLSPTCVRFYLDGFIPVSYHQVCQWLQINPNWLINVTHLRIETNTEPDRVVHFLGQHVTSLKVLYITVRWFIVLTPSLIDDLGNLKHLTKLQLGDIEMDYTALERSAVQLNLTSLGSILSCSLRINRFYGHVNADGFTRVLSVIFPNVLHLNIYLSSRINVHPSQHVFRFDLQPKLNRRFPNLRNSQLL